jgi:metallo-beta-lactamase family protein
MHAPIFATHGTVELAELVLLDSAKLQEEFAERSERRAQREAADDEEAAAEQVHAAGEVRDPERAVLMQDAEARSTIALPLYTVAQAQSALRLFHGIGYGHEVDVAEGVRATFFDAGHILGSAMIRVVATDGDGAPERTIVFSGDIGRPATPIIRDPSTFDRADYVVMESTYGGREHEPTAEAIGILRETIMLVARAKGVLLVPSFAIGRTQEIVYELDRLLADGKIPRLPVYLDSPMASKATDIYRRHADYFDEAARALLKRRDDPLDFPGARVTNDAADSKKIRSAPRPYMIVASNGMLTGGRVLHHLRNLIDDPTATLLFVGYQGQGTLGAHLQAGVKQVKLDGQMRDVRCQVRSISGFSAHADESELLDWARTFTNGRRPGDAGYPKTVFIVHGDPPAEAALKPKLEALGLTVHAPVWRERVELV